MAREISKFRIFLTSIFANITLTLLQRVTIGIPDTNPAVAEFVENSPDFDVVTFFFVIIFIVPLGEELMFRGLIWNFAKKYMNEGRVAWLIAVLFALLHSFETAIFLLPFSVYLSHLRYVSGSVKPGIVAHITFNATGLFLPAVASWVLI